ncbi:hypothetical protein L9F63_020962, partial [Diploptera punctata]
ARYAARFQTTSGNGSSKEPKSTKELLSQSSSVTTHLSSQGSVDLFQTLYTKKNFFKNANHVQRMDYHVLQSQYMKLMI